MINMTAYQRRAMGLATLNAGPDYWYKGPLADGRTVYPEQHVIVHGDDVHEPDDDVPVIRQALITRR